MNFLKSNFNLKIFIIIVFVLFILYNILKICENFIGEQPFKIVFDDISEPLILNEGTYSLNGDLKIPSIILKKVNNIVSFSIDSNYYALISLNNASPNIYRGEQLIQNVNIFKNVTSIQIKKNI